MKLLIFVICCGIVAWASVVFKSKPPLDPPRVACQSCINFSNSDPKVLKIPDGGWVCPDCGRVWLDAIGIGELKNIPSGSDSVILGSQSFSGVLTVKE